MATRRDRVRFDFNMRRRNLAGLMLASAAAWVALGALAGGHMTWEPAESVNSARCAAAAERIDPNTATVPSLRRLPGIGGELAWRIVECRGDGRALFSTLQDLSQVRGIGPAKIETAAPYLALPDLGEQSAGGELPDQ